MAWNFFDDGTPGGLEVQFGAFEKSVLHAFILTLFSGRHGHVRIRATDDLYEWYEQWAAVIGVSIPELENRKGDGGHRDFLAPRGRPFAVEMVSTRKPGRPIPPSALQKKLEWVARTLRLGRKEAAVLATLCRLTRVAPFRALCSAVCGYGYQRNEIAANAVGAVLGLGEHEISRVFSSTGQLIQLGLIEDRMAGDYAVSDMLVHVLRQRSTRPRDLEDALIGEPVLSSLGIADFAHLGSAHQDVLHIIRGTLRNRGRGVNLLFHGPPGTGKTEYARLLSDVCGARVVFAGEFAGEHYEPSRADRLTHLSLLSAIGKRAGRLIVVMDEADDIFLGVDHPRVSEKAGSKVFVNRLVENCPVPTVWIVNLPERLGESVLRRMVRAVAFRRPGPSVRRRVIERHALAQGIELDDAETQRLATLPATPAVLASALYSARLGSGGADMAYASAASICDVVAPAKLPAAAKTLAPFDPDLCTADIDLQELEKQVLKAGPTAISFLLTGDPGTGKTGFARHLAERLGLELVRKRGSDLLGMFVGETEANIAEAFGDAAASRSFLLFDEADSLLFDRRTATRSWETSQVNELLTWMETHPLPFAATTNMPDLLDQATRRRFVFTVHFVSMSVGQIDKAFRRFFASDAPRDVLDGHALTPGDFALVARKAAVMQVTDPERIAEMLLLEAWSKSRNPARIGFVQNFHRNVAPPKCQ